MIIRLLVFTGLRRGEIGDLRWTEVDLRRPDYVAARAHQERPGASRAALAAGARVTRSGPRRGT